MTMYLLEGIATDIRLPMLKHEIARHSKAYRYPQIFNNMKNNSKNKIHTHSLNGLKCYLKNKIISSYSTECFIENGYICNKCNHGGHQAAAPKPLLVVSSTSIYQFFLLGANKQNSDSDCNVDFVIRTA